ncbi:MAG: hypothetical protein GVY27_06660, partial [Deinococcus-Thermus bacterium]|nr:hypothetical protein [Deinococcota bacterium]
IFGTDLLADPGQRPGFEALLALDGALPFECVGEPDEARAALRAAGLPAEALGDAVPHHDGLSVILVADVLEDVPGELRVRGRPVRPEPVPLERVAKGTVKTLQLVVPSLRADVLGAKAFGASRSWFGKGVAAGKVRVDGAAAGKSASLESGSELWAEGLGRARLLSVEGETRRGNRKVRVEVEKP